MSTMVQNLENELIRQYVKVFTPEIFAWTSGANTTRFGIAAKIPLAPPASIAVEVNNSSSQSGLCSDSEAYCETYIVCSGRLEEL